MLMLKPGAYFETKARCGHTVANVTRHEMPVRTLMAALEVWELVDCDECYDDVPASQ